ncbi:MAG: hypothetical protein AAGF86_04425 [Pseudomonadota bacterium]
MEFDAVYAAEDIGSYNPSARNFVYKLAQLDRRGIGKVDILLTGQSMFHDHGPVDAHGLANCWIYRRHEKEGFGATVRPDEMPTYEFVFHGMADLVDAQKADLAA